MKARTLLEGNTETLQHAEALLRQLLTRDLDHYVRGRIFQRLWTAEQRLGRYRNYFSQAGQDWLVDQLIFKEKRDGTFVEIGAFDGVKGSNCLFFEKFRNWRGIVVEANPDLAAQLPRFRDVPVVQAAVCGHDGEADLVQITAGLTQMSGLADSYSKDILKRVRDDPRHRERRITVPTLRLETLLRSHGLVQVDYCSIDVEGAERAVLDGFDFAAFDIKVISAENATSSDADSLRDVLRPAGFRLVAILGADEIWSRL